MTRQRQSDDEGSNSAEMERKSHQNDFASSFETSTAKKTTLATVTAGAALFVAMTMCSSAGVVFSILTTRMNVPPFLAAAWRLLVQELVQTVPFLWILFFSKKSGKSQEEMSAQRYLKSLPWMLLSGIFLGVHFSMWVYSLRHTSLTHSLLWVSMGPILINGGAWIAFFATTLLSNVTLRRPSTMETTGAIMGLTGALVMLLDTRQSFDANNNGTQQVKFGSLPQLPTFQGDFAAFLGAVALCIYLVIGRSLRRWIPLWMYVFPVVGCAALTCIFFAFYFSDTDLVFGFGSSVDTDNNNALFGFTKPPFLWYALYLGIGPGIFGHALINKLLRYMSPLVVSTAMLTEPVLGSLVGYWVGVIQSLPGLWTWIGGYVLMVGLILVVWGEYGTTSASANDDVRTMVQPLRRERKEGDEKDPAEELMPILSVSVTEADMPVVVQYGSMETSTTAANIVDVWQNELALEAEIVNGGNERNGGGAANTAGISASSTSSQD